MKKSDFYFDLPEELIAQTPLERRDASRLLTLDKTTGAVAHHHFYELPQFLRPNDRRACSATAAPAVRSRCCCCATLATASGSA